MRGAFNFSMMCAFGPKGRRAHKRDLIFNFMKLIFVRHNQTFDFIYGWIEFC
jgi:hypothetical protein